MKFVGIDLAWSSKNKTGVCCLELNGTGLTMHSDPQKLKGHERVLSWLDQIIALGDPAIVAVDAPLVIKNASSQRACEKAVGRTYSSRDAGCYPMNLANGSAPSLLEFSRELETRGFAHGCDEAPQLLGRQQIEVYPHPAMVELFGLTKTLKYKRKPKRTGETRASEMATLRAHILSLDRAEPPLMISIEDVPGSTPGTLSTGAELNEAEDKLDAIVCAYIAAHWWFWGQTRNKVFGTREHGYIVVPTGLRVNLAS